MNYRNSKIFFVLVAVLALLVSTASADLLVTSELTTSTAPDIASGGGGGILAPSLAEFNGKIYAMGHWFNNKKNNTVFVSEDGLNWSVAGPVAGMRGRNRVGMVVFQDKLWVIGGAGESGGEAFNDVWYTEDGVNWTEATSNGGFTPRGDFKPLVYDGKVWIIGGMQGGDSGFQKDVWYSSDGINWTEATDDAPWGPRAAHSTAVVGGEMLVYGGTYEGGAAGWNDGYSDVWASTDGVNWTTKTANGFPTRVLFDSCVIDGNIVAYIGANSVWDSSGTVAISADSGVTWTELNADANTMMDAGVIYFNGKLVVVGGNDLGWGAEDAEVNTVFDVPDFANRPKIYAYIDGGADGDGLTPATAIRSNMDNALNLIRDGLTSGVILTASGTINRTLGQKVMDARNGDFDNGKSYTVVGGLEFNPSTAVADVKFAGETVIDFADNGSAKFLKTEVYGSSVTAASTNPVNLYNLTFANANGNGAPIEIVHKDSAPEMNYNFVACRFEDGAGSTGAAIRIGDGPSPFNLILSDCEFDNNHATGSGSWGGGAIYGWNVNSMGILATNTTFHNNTTDAQYGGAIAIQQGSSPTAIDWIFQNCTITSNVANTTRVNSGGGFLAFQDNLIPHVQFIDSLMHNNHCGGNGGGVVMVTKSSVASDLTVDGCTVTSNTCAIAGDWNGMHLGGGFAHWYRDDPSLVTLKDTYFGFNKSYHVNNDYGGGVMQATSSMDVDGCTFEGNWSSGRGGAIGGNANPYRPDVVDIADSYFLSNSAANEGGAINFKNVAGGGAVYNFTNTVFAYNQAPKGSVMNVNDPGDTLSELNFANCSFIANRATDGGWATTFKSSWGDRDLWRWGFVNCLFADNQVNGAVGNFEGVQSESGHFIDNCHFYNTVDIDDGASVWHWHDSSTGVGILVPTNTTPAIQWDLGADPELTNFATVGIGDLSNVYGFGTPVTDFVQLTSSTLIDAGADTHTTVTLPMADYAGVARPQNLGYDIGAFEVKMPVYLMTSSTLDLGTVIVGSSSTLSVPLTAGLGNVAITTITATGDFMIQDIPATVGAQSTENFTVVFQPTAEGAASGTVTVTSDAVDSPATINVTGTGEPAIPAIPAAVDQRTWRMYY